MIVMNAKIVFVALSIALLLAACAPAPRPQPQPVVQPPAQVVQTAPATTDAEVSSIESSSAQVDQLDKEFDTTEFEQIDKDLAELENLDLG